MSRSERSAPRWRPAGTAIPWEGVGPLPLDRMSVDTREGPLDVPLHPAAEAYWRERGYRG